MISVFVLPSWIYANLAWLQELNLLFNCISYLFQQTSGVWKPQCRTWGHLNMISTGWGMPFPWYVSAILDLCKLGRVVRVEIITLIKWQCILTDVWCYKNPSKTCKFSSYKLKMWFPWLSVAILNLCNRQGNGLNNYFNEMFTYSNRLLVREKSIASNLAFRSWNMRFQWFLVAILDWCKLGGVAGAGNFDILQFAIIWTPLNTDMQK